MFLYCNFFIVDNFNVKKRLKFKHYLYICAKYLKVFKKYLRSFLMELA